MSVGEYALAVLGQRQIDVCRNLVALGDVLINFPANLLDWRAWQKTLKQQLVFSGYSQQPVLRFNRAAAIVARLDAGKETHSAGELRIKVKHRHLRDSCC